MCAYCGTNLSQNSAERRTYRFRFTVENVKTGARQSCNVRAANESEARATITNPDYRIVRVEMLIG